MTEKEMILEAFEWQTHIHKLASDAKNEELYHKRSKVLDWLIQQAERVEELEKFKQETEDRYKIWHIGAKKSVEEKEKLKEQNKRYREAIENIINLWKNATESTDDRELTSLMYKEAIKALEGEE